MDLTLSQKYAIKQCLMTTDNIFVTGPAGTGKSHVMKQVCDKLSRYVVVAPTGVAASQVDGMTIQSLFKIRGSPSFNEYVYKYINVDFDVLIIDEISMVDEDLLRIIDYALKKSLNSDKPMGGLRLIAFGDFRQLPPLKLDNDGRIQPCKLVCETNLWNELNFKVCYLHKIMRNKNQIDKDVLKLVRAGIENDEVIAKLTSLTITEEQAQSNTYNMYIHLFFSNDRMNLYNKKRLDEMSGKLYNFKSNICNKDYGNVQCLLSIKVGARVMCIKNLPSFDVFNGNCGYVINIENDVVSVRMDNDRIVNFGYETWYCNRSKVYTPVISQIPLKLAWGISIAKSQGMTLDKVVAYFTNNMFPGQAYVAMTRVKCLDNLRIVNYVPSHNSLRCVESSYE